MNKNVYNQAKNIKIVRFKTEVEKLSLLWYLKINLHEFFS